MSHEDDRLATALPDIEKLEIHLLACQRVERTERLVHQNKLWIMDQRARYRRALLHAAGKLIRIFVLEAGKPDHGEEFARALAAFADRQA